MDITNFMTWFISQVVNMFSWFFGILDNITFCGTSLLKVSITILILGSLLGVILTLTKGLDFIGSRSEHIEQKKERREKQNANKK